MFTSTIMLLAHCPQEPGGEAQHPVLRVEFQRKPSPLGHTWLPGLLGTLLRGTCFLPGTPRPLFMQIYWPWAGECEPVPHSPLSRCPSPAAAHSFSKSLLVPPSSPSTLNKQILQFDTCESLQAGPSTPFSTCAQHWLNPTGGFV